VLAIITTIGIFKPSQFVTPDNPHQYPLGLTLTALSAILIAAYIHADPIGRLPKIERAVWFGGFLGATTGLLVYWQVEPVFTLFHSVAAEGFGDFLMRVHGGYKDPNVYSTWLIWPTLSLMQALLVGRAKANLFNLTNLALLMLALLLAFSRGAWGVTVAAGIASIAMTMHYSEDKNLRKRIIIITIAGLAVLGLVFAVAYSIPEFQTAFLDRFVLLKKYDVGEGGRFNNQLNSLVLLLQQPFGIGPYEFAEYFQIAPHNTFLNAFFSAGWTGGMLYLLFFFTNCIMAWRIATTRSAFQTPAIVIGMTLIVMQLQGLQIDTEHWRHLYWLMGMTWGLYASLGAQNLNSAAKPKPAFEIRQQAHA
jgi:hypothetical protein